MDYVNGQLKELAKMHALDLGITEKEFHSRYQGPAKAISNHYAKIGANICQFILVQPEAYHNIVRFHNYLSERICCIEEEVVYLGEPQAYQEDAPFLIGLMPPTLRKEILGANYSRKHNSTVSTRANGFSYKRAPINMGEIDGSPVTLERLTRRLAA
ncbi:hypothetical protein FWH09_01795 [Candidatus Saccharibacteria bacterium]|nr:hypothetical protein [Candidatus Saccharibacteria bacterium]